MESDNLQKHHSICIDRGYHDFQEFIDPKSGGFMRCKDCELEMDCEDPDGESGMTMFSL
jgi:hypothetical protein